MRGSGGATPTPPSTRSQPSPHHHHHNLVICCRFRHELCLEKHQSCIAKSLARKKNPLPHQAYRVIQYRPSVHGRVPGCPSWRSKERVRTRSCHELQSTRSIRAFHTRGKKGKYRKVALWDESPGLSHQAREIRKSSTTSEEKLSGSRAASDSYDAFSAKPWRSLRVRARS